MSILEGQVGTFAPVAIKDKTWIGARDFLLMLANGWNKVIKPTFSPKVWSIPERKAFGGAAARTIFKDTTITAYFDKLSGGVVLGMECRGEAKEFRVPPSLGLPIALLAGFMNDKSSAASSCCGKAVA